MNGSVTDTITGRSTQGLYQARLPNAASQYDALYTLRPLECHAMLTLGLLRTRNGPISLHVRSRPPSPGNGCVRCLSLYVNLNYQNQLAPESVRATSFRCFSIAWDTLRTLCLRKLSNGILSGDALVKQMQVIAHLQHVQVKNASSIHIQNAAI